MGRASDLLQEKNIIESSSKPETPTSNSGGRAQRLLEEKGVVMTSGAQQITTAPVVQQRNGVSRDSGVRQSYAARNDIEKEEPSLFSRMGDIFLGTVKQLGSGLGNTASTMYETGQSARDLENQATLDTYKRSLERARRDLDAMLAKGGFDESEIQSQRHILEDAQRKYDAMLKVTGGQAQQEATQAAYSAADNLAASGAQDIEEAKEGLGAVGRLAVDAASAGLGMAADAALGAATGGGTLFSMGLRGFGSGAQEARQSGASLEQQVAYGAASAAMSAAVERIANVSEPFRRMFGAGALDQAIGKVTGSLGQTAVGKLALSALSEGGEEFAEAVFQPVLQKVIYNPDASFNLEEALYQAAIGAVLGGVGGVGDVAITRAAGASEQELQKPQLDPDGSLAWSKILDNITTERQDSFTQARNIAKRFGADLQVGPLKNGAAGEYSQGTITISPTAANPVRQVLVHELTHHMETSGLYSRFSDRVLGFISQDMNVDVDALKRSIIQEYSGYGVELDSDGAGRELVAKFAQERLFQDEAAIQRLLQTDRNLFQRVYDWIRDTLAKVKGTSEERFLIDAQRLYEKALRQAGTQAGAGATQNTFGGVNARAADLTALQTARQMEQQGTQADAIRQQTGWFRGMDGKWRFEIDDSGMEYDHGGNLRGAVDRQWAAEDYENAAEDLFNGITEGQAAKVRAYNRAGIARNTDEQQRLAQELAGEVGFLFENYVDAHQRALETRGNPTGGALADYIHHPELFANYPQLRHAALRFERMDDGKRGYYNPETGDIAINAELRDAQEDTLIHEIQHAIQAAEGFTPGASPQYWTARNSLGAERNRTNTEGYYRGLYRNTAGEIEARDAAERRTLTPEQRLLRMPRLADENTVFAEHDGVWQDFIPGMISRESVRQGIQEVAEMEPVAKIEGTEFAKGDVDLITQVTSFFNSIGGMAYNPQLGDVQLTRRGVKADISHGIGRKKAAAFAAVPEVLRNGRVIDYQSNWKGRGYDTAAVAAPVTIGEDTYLAGIILNRNQRENTFYIHEVLLTEKGTAPFKTGGNRSSGSVPGGDAPSVMSLLRKVQDVKNNRSTHDMMPSLGDGQFSMGRSFNELVADLRMPRLTDPAAEVVAPMASPGDSDTDGYLDALARDENDLTDPITPANHVYDAKLHRLQQEEAPLESVRERVAKRDVDELVELYQSVANPVASEREVRFVDSEAMVSAETEKTRKSLRQAASEARSFFMRKMVDAGDSVTRLGKVVKDSYLYPFYNMARGSATAGINMIQNEQTDITGKRVGESLNDIFTPIRERGEDYYNQFQTYLFDLHNIDRMSLVTGENTARIEAEMALREFDRENPEVATLTEERLHRKADSLDPEEAALASERLRLLRKLNQADRMGNKPVFGWEVTADMSRERSDRLLREHPEFAGYQEQVRRYIRNLMQYRVDSGLITAEDAAFLERFYPNYVPTFRQTENAQRGRDGKRVQVGKTVGRAEGGDQKLAPLHEALGRQTMQVVREGSKNRFGVRLLQDYQANRQDSNVRRYILDAREHASDFSTETFDQEDIRPQKGNTFVIYKDDKKYELAVDPSMFDAVKALSPDAEESNIAIRAIRAGNNLFKALVTGYNPTFAIRNTVRDLQTAGMYSRDGVAFAVNYPLALREIATDGEYWKQYKALGGSFSSVFDYQTGTVQEPDGKIAKLAARMQAINMAMEQAPRLAEFMSVVKKGDGSLENLMDAMHAAADVTVNFGRAGTLGKVLNANFVPFLNPGIQGFDKMVRRVTETRGAKEWAKLALRAAALGVAPSVLNSLLYSDDENWEDLRDSDKDANYMFRIGDGIWLKIPKGRELSILGMAADRAGDMARGENVNWGDFIVTVGNQVAPANPLRQNILAAWFDTDLFNASSPGRTWYGGDIESQRLQNYAPGERYDSSTDIFSKWLGQQLNLSPAKINYLLDQYSGVVGDFVLPLLTTQAERDPFTKAFTVDSVSSNQISSEFYNKSEELTYAKNGGDATAKVLSRFWSRQQSAASDIYAQIREIENSGLSDAEKKERVREARAILNGIQKNALEVMDIYRTAAEKHLSGDTDMDIEWAYREANRECFGAEYALEVYSKDTYEKAQQAHQNGVSYEDFYTYYFDTKGFTSSSGKSANTQKMEYLQASGLDRQAQAEIYFADLASDSDLTKQAELEESCGISAEQYWQYKAATSGISADKDENGNRISGSKKEKTLVAIDGLDLTPNQKTALYYAAGYPENTLDEAPWISHINAWVGPELVMPRLDAEKPVLAWQNNGNQTFVDIVIPKLAE